MKLNDAIKNVNAKISIEVCGPMVKRLEINGSNIAVKSAVMVIIDKIAELEGSTIAELLKEFAYVEEQSGDFDAFMADLAEGADNGDIEKLFDKIFGRE